MNFIPLTKYDGTTIWVNLNNVLSFQQGTGDDKKYTQINMINDGVFVQETPEYITEKIIKMSIWSK